jgi:hypothetical protein
MQRLFQRATSQRESLVVADYNLASSGRRRMMQPRIDIGSWMQKGKNANEAISKAWSKFFHIMGELGRQADNPYFVSVVRETNGVSFLLMQSPMSLHSCILMVAGEGIASPTG